MDGYRHDADTYRRIEVITGDRRRRDWSAEEKARIVAESGKHPSSHAGERRARDVELSYDARAQVQAACC